MVAGNLVLIAGAGGVGRTVLDHLRAQDVPVRAVVRRDDARAAELRMRDAMSPDHLLAATVVASVAREYGQLAGLVGMSQMTVSQMTATSTTESHQQRLHWLVDRAFVAGRRDFYLG